MRGLDSRQRVYERSVIPRPARTEPPARGLSVKAISRFLPSAKVKDRTTDSELAERPERPRPARTQDLTF